jgi:hypothetical protein
MAKKIKSRDLTVTGVLYLEVVRIRKAMPYVDLAFRLTGSKVPVDHGYAL